MDTHIRVLYVEDNQLDRELVRDALEREHGGFALTEARSREEFERHLAEAEFDIVLSDFNIAGFEGFDVLKITKRENPETPVIIVTGTGSEEVAAESMKSGAADYVIKTPDHIRRLPLTIKAVIENKLIERERRQTLEALKESEERYRGLVECSIDHIFILSQEGIYLNSNDRLDAFEIKNGEKLVGKSIFDVYPKDVAAFYRSQLEEVVAGGNPVSFEHSMPGSNGSEYHVDTLYPLYRDGEIWAVGGICRNVTARRRAEDALNGALKQAEKRGAETEALLQSSRAVLEHKSFNDAARSIFDYCRELIGAKAGYVALLSADGEENELLFLESGGDPCTVDPELPMPVRGLRAEAYRGNKPVYDNNFSTSEWMRFMPEGHVALKNVLFAPLIIEGRADGVIGIANKPADFTEDDARMAQAFGEVAAVALKNSQTLDALEESEEKYRALVSQSADCIFLTDAETKKVIESNQAMAQLLGYSREEIVGMPIYDFIAHDRESIDAKIQRAIEGEPVRAERKWRRKDGTLVDVEIKVNTILYKGKKVLCNVTRDITERKHLQAQLFQAQKMESLGTLVAGVAHEINNPINAIKFNAPLFQKIWKDIMPIVEQHAVNEPDSTFGGLPYDFVQQNLSQLLADINSSADRIVKIVASLKSFSRQSDLGDKKPLDLNQAIRNTVALTQTALRKRDTEVKLSLVEGIPEIQGDSQSIEQVLLNLIINANQAMEGDGGTIEIASRHDQKNKKAIIEVRDNGKGIEPAIRDRVFDPFVTTRQAEGGTGLGLSVSYNLVEAHGGKLSFKTAKDKGTTFTIAFPLAREDEKKLKILIADDDEIVREVLRRSFAKDGRHEVAEALDGTEACIKLGTFRPDVLILDLVMPEMDGLAVCRTIKQDPLLAETRVIVMTGFPDDPRIEEIKKLGISHIFSKPFNPEDITKVVNDMVREQGTRKQG